MHYFIFMQQEVCIFGYLVTEHGMGEFGMIYSGIVGQDALNFILEAKSGEIKGAFYRVEIGEIDLVWGEKAIDGKEGHGLAHIIEKHPEIFDKISMVITEGSIYTQGSDRLLIVKNVGENQNQVAAIRLDWNGLQKTWLVSAFNEP
jgi:hypothetical protein